MSNRTAFFEIHQQLGAKLIDFGGFEMPVQYQGIRVEHLAVRERLGLFDVSHMGEFFVTGDAAREFLQYVTINDITKLTPGKAQYSAMCTPEGGIIDDLIVYCLGDQEFMLVVNASNIEKDFAWLTAHKRAGVILENRSEQYCLLAIQGPRAKQVLSKLTSVPLDDIAYYHFAVGSLGNIQNVIISATGYTGEPGYELYFDKTHSDPAQLWNRIMEAGANEGITPCGLGCRDTLRLEMGYCLYGNDIDEQHNPIEAGLSWITKLEKGAFIGRDPIVQAKTDGPKVRLTGFVMDDEKAIPRKGYSVLNEHGDAIGEVTSGTMSISLNQGIGLGYITSEYVKEHNVCWIDIRGKQFKATIQKPPFLKK